MKNNLNFYTSKNFLHKIIRYLQSKKKIYHKGQYYLIACLPKSGSTFVSKTIAELFNFHYDTFVSGFNQIEHDLFEPKLIKNLNKNVIIHQHLKAADANVKLLEKYNVKTIVLTRNVYDIIVSFYDHLHNETLKWSMLMIEEDFFSLNEQEKYDMIIDFLTPWIFNFYVSWYRASKDLKVHWIKYEDVINSPQSSIEKIIWKWNLEKQLDSDKLKKILSRSKKSTTNRFNKGISGRGRKILSKKQIDRIHSFTNYYTDINFEFIGL